MQRLTTSMSLHQASEHSSANIQVISFDLDDTLWDNRPVMQRAEAAMWAALQTHFPNITAEFDAQSLRQLASLVPDELMHDVTAIRQHILATAAKRTGEDPEAVVEKVFSAFLHARSQVKPFPDAIPTLAKLSERYTLIALTNGNVNLSTTTVAPYFERLFTPAEMGAKKPNPQCFTYVEQQLQLPASAFVHVGDSWEHDVQAAFDAQWQAIWFNPAPPAHAEGTVIRSLTELLTLL